MKRSDFLKSLATFIFIAIICGCNKNTIYVWNMKDIIGLWFGGIVIVIVLIIIIYAWIADKIESFKRKRKTKP